MTMAKQTNPRKPESVGKGKVTPVQIAFIVDRYLCDNNFSDTRSTFRTEASSLIAKWPITEVPKSLLSLGEMLNEYICLKEQKMMLDQERIGMEREKNRVQMLLQGMQNVMNAYSASRTLPSPNVAVMNANSAVVPQPRHCNKTPSGVPSTTTTTTAKTTTATTMQNTPHVQSLPKSINTNAEIRNFSTPVISASDRKRKATEAVDAPSVAKKSHVTLSSRKIPVQGQNTLPQSSNAGNNQVSQLSSATQSSVGNCIPMGSPVQGAIVAKCLFIPPSLSIPTKSPVPKTPTRTNSSHSDTYIPPEISSVATCNGESTPTCYTVVSTKRVSVSPANQMAYVESSHCISPAKTDSDKISKGDHVRSRLDFDASDMPESLDKSLPNEISTSQSDEEVDLSGIDFSNFDILGMDFSFTEMLSDLEFPCDFFCHPEPSHSKDNASGSSHECKVNEVMSELPSTVSEALSEKDMNIQGPDCLTATKSVTRCIKILSPVKSRRRSLDQENC